MSKVPDLDPMTLTENLELTAEALRRRAEEMLALSDKLLIAAGNVAPLAEKKVEHSVGRLGAITEVDAIRKAEELQRFTRQEFAAALGLSATAINRWIGKLIDRSNPIIQRDQDGSFYYVEPHDNGARRRSEPTPEQKLVDSGAGKDRGIVQGVSASQRAFRTDKSLLSRPGVSHRIRQKEAANQRVTDAQNARDRARKSK